MSHREGTNVADAERTSCPEDKFQVWRPRRRKLVPLAFIALILSLLLFFKEFSSPKDLNQWRSAQPPSFVAETDIFASTTHTAPTATNTDIVHKDEEPVVFTLVIWSEPSAAEGALLIKVSPLAVLRNCLIHPSYLSPYSSTTPVPPKYTSFVMILLTDIWRPGCLWSLARLATFAYCSISLHGKVCWTELNGRGL